MKPPQMQGSILAHLKAARGPVTSRDLAARFLMIRNADEETCRRLLAPILETVRGIGHRADQGWTYDARGVAGSAGGAPAIGVAASAAVPGPASRPRGVEVTASGEGFDSPAVDEGSGSLLDVVALAVDGVGPGGSGAPRALTYLPVIDGEELQEEHLPAWGIDSDGIPVADDEVPVRGPAARGGQGGLGADEMQALAEAVGDLPVVAHRAAREVEPICRAAEAAGVTFRPRIISAARLGHLLVGLKANHAAADLATALGVEAPGPDDCRGRARLVARSYLRMLPLLAGKGIRSVEALLEFQDMPAAPLDLSSYAFTAEDLRGLPAAPGVYRFLDRQDAVIYIGKARNLRVRVGSYFTPGARGTAKGRAILEQVHRIVTTTVGSELEANLLEAALLAEHRPPLNRQFEVHERPAPYGPRLNLVVVLRDAEAPSCTLHFLRNGRYLKRLPAIPPPGSAGFDADGLRAVLDSSYFGPAAARDEGTEIDWALVSSFLRRHHDAVNVLDVDECGSPDDAAQRLAVLVQAAAAGAGKVLAR